MKQSILRMMSAFLLMAIALGLTLGFFVAAKETEPIYVWQSITFASAEDVTLFSEAGAHVQTLIANETQRLTSKLLPAGKYYAFSNEACVEFLLFEDRKILVEGGCGWTDGNVLYFTDSPVGSVCVGFSSDREGVYTLTLFGGDVCRRKVVRAVGEAVFCDFFGVPYGTYLVFLNQEQVARVNIDAQTPNISLALAQ